MKKFVQIFEERLRISREKAIARLLSFCLLGLLIVIIIFVTIYLFPINKNIQEKSILLYNDYLSIKIDKNHDPHKGISISKSDFIKISKGGEVVLSFDKISIIYSIFFNGNYYNYHEKMNKNFSYSISSIRKYEDGVFIIEKNRDAISTIIINIAFPIILIMIFLFIMYLLQANYDFGPTENGKYDFKIYQAILKK